VRRAIALAAIALCSAHAAAADPAPEPVATRAGDANLESTEQRRGFTFGVQVGPSLTFGADVGTGGALALRVGEVATPWTVIDLELAASAVLHSVEDPADPDGEGRLVANSNAALLVGVQHWVNPSLFLRLGVGGGRYRCNECGAPRADGMRSTEKYAGVAGSLGVGLDLVRWGSVVLGAEVHSVSLITLDGLLVNTSLGLTLSVD
jgi:hypothetical protein